MTSRKFSTFPHDPARSPFFYGWTILVLGTMGLVMTVPGQTIGVSVFTGSLVSALGISRSDLSLAYLVGTAGSALLLSVAGRLYDSLGARLLSAASAAVLGVILIVASFSPEIASAIDSVIGGGRGIIAFIVITAVFFVLRFSGQGMLAMSSRNMVMEWFDKKRGLANAVMGVAVSFGFSLAPRLFESLVRHGGWRGAWQLLSVILLAFALFSLLMFRNRPEDHGLIPDGRRIVDSGNRSVESSPTVDFTAREARRTFVFWQMSLTLLMAALITTAFTFHIVALFRGAGMSETAAVGIFLPGSLVALAFQFGGSWASDYIKLKYFAMIQLAGLMLLCVATAYLAPGWPVIVAVAGYGLNQGMFGILGNITWPRFFGRRHLGAISGFAAALGVAGSAAGPYLFSLAHDLTGAYRLAAIVCLVLCAILFIGSWWAERPRVVTASGETAERI